MIAPVRGPLIELDPAVIELDPADVARTLAVTAYGGLLVAQAAAKRMLPHGHGAISVWTWEVELRPWVERF